MIHGCVKVQSLEEDIPCPGEAAGGVVTKACWKKKQERRERIYEVPRF